MEKFDFIASFYSTRQDRDTIIKSIESIIVSQNLTVYAIPFGSTYPLDEFFGKTSYKRKIKSEYENHGIRLYELRYYAKEIGQEKIGRFFIYEHPEYKNIFVAISIDGGEFYRYALLPFLKALRPRIMLTFITHKKLRKFLEDFRTKYQINKMIISRASYRLRVEEKEKCEHIIPGISWPNMDLEQAFNWVYQNNGWFHSIQFKIEEGQFSSTRISFTRQGIIQTNALFPKVFESLTLPVCKTIHENIEFFGKRSRRENNFSTRPLLIEFETDQFAEISENKKFIDALKRLKTASVSVLHSNPYVHMSVIDYIDGSNFDLWVTDFDKIFIVPQMKGTIPSIKRLINHIFDTYAEGGIKDYSEVIRGASK